MLIDSNTLRKKLELIIFAYESMAKTERDKPDWVRGVIDGLVRAISELPRER
jgi:hypothetical protein